ncbi:MAG: FAD-dependent monooxygenase, partial [Thermoplasmata archaeon]|nr:FAD-dependent monooxygenase [Thermoplasmata archaeon]
MQIECDVLVVGAGPAGLATAVLLSKKGFTSAVIEKGKSVGLHNIKYDITEGNIISGILKKLGIKP